MSISLEEVRRIARLARLSFSPEEEDRLRDDLGKILQYMSKLEELDLVTTKIESAPESAPGLTREDVVAVRVSPAELVARGPQTIDGMFTVPKVIE